MVWISWARRIHLLTERTRTSPEAVLLCSQSQLFDTPKMLWTHWFCTHCFLQLSRHVHDHFSVVLEVLHLLLSEHEFPLLHGSPTHDVKPCLWDFVQTSSDVLHGHCGKVLVARVVCTTRDLHTDAHLELVLVLVLSLFWTSSCACSGPRPVPAVDNVLVFSFTRAHPCGWVCSFDLLHVFIHPS